MPRPPIAQTRRRTLSRAGALSIALAVSATLAGCQSREPVPFDPLAMQQEQIEAARKTTFREFEPVEELPRDERGFLKNAEVTQQETERGAVADPGFGQISAPPSEATTRPATQPSTELASDDMLLALPLSEVVSRAAMNNFDVTVAAYEPAIEATRDVEARARFDPTFQQRVEGRYAERQVAGQLIDLASIVSDLQRVYSSSTALTQNLPSGGQASLRYDITYLDSPTSFARGLTQLEETFESALTLRVTQPLLRDFGRDVNRARITIAGNDRQISILEFRSRLEQVLVDVESTYWQLYAARQEVVIQRDLLQRTIDTAQRIAQRGVLDATEFQIAQANRDVAQRRANLIRAEAQAINLSDQLKFLMNDPDLPVAGPVVIAPATPPVEVPLTFDFEDAVQTALLLRPEIAQQLIRERSASTILRVSRNNLLPRLDAVVEAGFQGLDEDYIDAVENQFEFESITGAAGLQLEIPLGNRAARAIERRSRLQRLQAATQYAALQQQVTLEVKQTQQNVSAAYAALAQLRRAVDGAAEAVRVIDAQQGQVPLSPQFSDLKLRTLDDLARARSAEERGLADYNSSIALYERAKGTLLRYNNIVLDDAARDAILPINRPALSPNRGVAP